MKSFINWLKGSNDFTIWDGLTVLFVIGSIINYVNGLKKNH